MKGISNKHTDWEPVYKDLLNNTTLTAVDRGINVTLGPVNDETGDIPNLRYFSS